MFYVVGGSKHESVVKEIRHHSVEYGDIHTLRSQVLLYDSTVPISLKLFTPSSEDVICQ